MKLRKTSNQGITLIELLIVIVVIIILFMVIMAALNPARRFAQSRNTVRTSDMETIQKAISLRNIDTGGNQAIPLPSTPTCIGTGGAGIFDLQNITWNENIPTPDSDIKFNVRSCATADCIGATWSSDFLNNSAANDPNLANNQYFQYKADFAYNSYPTGVVVEEQVIDPTCSAYPNSASFTPTVRTSVNGSSRSLIANANSTFVFIYDSHAFITNEGTDTLNIIDAYDPFPPNDIEGIIGTRQDPISVYVQDKYAYVVTGSAVAGSGYLQVFDISQHDIDTTPPINNPSPLVGEKFLGAGTNPKSVYVIGSYAYVANYDSDSLMILNVSNPASITITSTISLPAGSKPRSIYVYGKYAYVGNYGTDKLRIIDVSDPNNSNPTFAEINTEDSPRSVQVAGRYAYIVNQLSDSLQVFNVSNPASPVLVGRVSTDDAPFSLFISGRNAYVTNIGSDTLQVFDISNPASPVLTGSVSTVSSNPGAVSDPISVSVTGGFAYVADYISNDFKSFNVFSKEITPCYTSLYAWDNQNRNLITENKILAVKIIGDWSAYPDTTPVNINDWKTDANHYIHIYTTPEARHSGKWDPTKYRLEISSRQDAVDISVQDIRIEGLQVTRGWPADSNGQGGFVIWSCSDGQDVPQNDCDIRIANNIFKGVPVPTGSFSSRAIEVWDNTASAVWPNEHGKLYAWNNIIYNYQVTPTASSGAGAGMYLYDQNGDFTTYAYNNTVYNNNAGYERVSGAFVAKNNISYNNVNNYSGTFSALGTNNLAGPGLEIADMPANNPKNPGTVSFVSTTSGSEDFHLASTDTGAKDEGTSLNTDANRRLFDDIDGDQRIGTWDIGADEFHPTIEEWTIVQSANNAITCNTTNRICNSLNAWETAAQSDLTAGLGKIVVAKIDGTWTAPDTTAVTIDGWTTDTTHYIKIYTTPTARHNGAWGSGYRLEVNGGRAISIKENYVWIDGLAIYNSSTAAGSSGVGPTFGTWSDPVTVGEIKISNSLLRGGGASNVDWNSNWAIANSNISMLKAWNNIIYNWGGWDGIGDGVDGGGMVTRGSGRSLVSYNNTVYNSFIGYSQQDLASVTSVNNIYQSNGLNGANGFDGTFTSSNYNISNFAGAPGANSSSQSISSLRFISTVAGSENLHISPNSVARDAGTPLSGDFNKDIDGEIHLGAWDIGADEEQSVNLFLSLKLLDVTVSGSVVSTGATSSLTHSNYNDFLGAVNPLGTCGITSCTILDSTNSTDATLGVVRFNGGTTATYTSPVISPGGCFNLNTYIAPKYLQATPKDPSGGTDADTGYMISIDTTGNITVSAPKAELNETISSKRK